MEVTPEVELIKRGHAGAWPTWAMQPLGMEDILRGWRDALVGRGTVGFPSRFQVYLHVPYCKEHCRFCMYWHVVSREGTQLSSYVDYLLHLMRNYGETLGRIEVDAAYFGGGTPSLFSTPDMERLLQGFGELFDLGGRYFSVECHPGTLDGAKLESLAAHGVTRVSFGTQSLDAGVLQTITRTNPSPAETESLVRRSRALGMRVNVDLVLGIHGQTLPGFLEGVDRVLGFGASEITVYSFVPMGGIAAEPGEEFGFDQVFSQAFLERIAARGYRPVNMGRKNASGILLVRTDEPEPAFADAYYCFEPQHTQLIGLGPGAYSHLYGWAWYREVTSLDRGVPGRRPAFVGTRLGLADEVRTEVLRDLASGHLIDPHRVQKQTGLDVFDVLGVPAGDAAFEYEGSAFRLRTALPDDARDALTSRILERLPPRTTPEDAPPLHGAPLDTGHKAPHELRIIRKREQGEQPKRPHESPVVADWRELIGLPAVGGRIGKATVEAIRDGRVRFSFPSSPALEIEVRRRGEEPCYASSRRFSILYVGAPGQPLTSGEHTQLLEELVRRTRRADSAPD